MSSRCAAGLFQEVLELLGPVGVAELSERFGFDLPDPLAGNSEVAAHLFQRPGSAVFQAEAELQYLRLAVAEGS